MQSDEHYLMELASRRLEDVIIDQNDKFVKINNNTYHCFPIPLQRRVIHLILNYLYKSNAPFSSIHIEDLRSLLDSEHPSSSLDLPQDLRVVKSYDTCYFTFETFEEAESYTSQLPVSGSVETPLGTITSTLVD